MIKRKFAPDGVSSPPADGLTTVHYAQISCP